MSQINAGPNEVKKIIWAVDAFQQTDKIQRCAAQAIRSLHRLKNPGVTIEPVFVIPVSPATKPIRKFSQILFPTDFDEESATVFPRVLALSKSLKAELTILHVVYKSPLAGPTTRMYWAQKEYVKRQTEQGQEHAKKYLEHALKMGVNARYEPLVSNDTTSEAVVRFARKHHMQLVAMAARSGKVSSALAGSVTRQIVRASPFPVWVLREGRMAVLVSSEAA